MMGLSEKAMLVCLGISQWTGRRYDKDVSARVAFDYGTDLDVGRYNKVLIAEESLKTIGKTATEARTFHYSNTLPWLDNGQRILPSANYLDYTQAMQAYRQKFESAVSDFTQAYPDLVLEAQTRLNGMFKAQDYPPVDEIGAKYGFDVLVLNLPAAEDFRVSLQQSEVDAIRQDIECRISQAQAVAMRDLWDRLHTAVSHAAEKLGDSDSIFRDSLVENLVELCELLPKLNIMEDPNLETMRREVESKLCGSKAQELRDNPAAREQAAKSAAEILETMKGYTG